MDVTRREAIAAGAVTLGAVGAAFLFSGPRGCSPATRWL